jgi:hypothetical protein
MNTQLKLKTRQLLSSLTLLIGVVVVLALSGPSTQAQTSTGTTDTTATTVPAGVVDSSVTLPAKGTITDPNGAISVSGSVIVNCRRVVDTTSATTPTLVLLDFDFSQLTGTSGSTKTTLKTYVTGGNHASEIRPLQAADTIIVTTPYYDNTKDGLSAKTMLITATLNFDVGTGTVTSGSISIGDNVVTKQAVSTVGAAPAF